MVHSVAVGVQCTFFSSVSLSLSVRLSLSFGEAICPIVGSKEALFHTNEIKAHLGEGINQTDRFNGPEQGVGGADKKRGGVNGQIAEICHYQQRGALVSEWLSHEHCSLHGVLLLSVEGHSNFFSSPGT